MNALTNIKALTYKVMPTDPARAMFINQTKQAFHPAVEAVLTQYEPVNWVDLFWQWPYVSKNDPTKLAYSRNERHLIDDRQTITSVSKYLKMHFPQVPDHVLQGFSKVEHAEEFAILDNLQDMVAALEVSTKAWSCMQDNVCMQDLAAYIQGEADELDIDESPYRAYDPNLGWRMAVRRTSKWNILGRALINVYDHKIFTRSYTAPDEEGRKNGVRSMADTLLEDWLNNRGFRKTSLAGKKLAKIQVNNTCGYLLPYLDGDADCVSDNGNTWVITSDYDAADWRCNCTTGDAEEIENEGSCECCGDRMDEDESVYIEDENRYVCTYCCNRHYTYIVDEGYISDEYAITVDGDNYDSRSLPGDIVELENGYYSHIDNTVCINDRYYADDHCNVVELAEEDSNGNTHSLTGHAWQHTDGDWYSDEVAKVTIDCENYKEEDCEQDDITLVWYVPGTEMLEMPCGLTVHPSNPAALQEELALEN